MTNNLAYCLGVEKLLGLEIPERAIYLRVLLQELTRIQSHLVWLGTHCLDIGALTMFLYCFREREQLLRIFENISGQRMMTSYVRIGGLSMEPPLDFYKQCQDFITDFPSKIAEYEGLLNANPIWKGRLQWGRVPLRRGRHRPSGSLALLSAPAESIGTLAAICLTAGYEKFQFNVPTSTIGRRLGSVHRAHG